MRDFVSIPSNVQITLLVWGYAVVQILLIPSRSQKFFTLLSELGENHGLLE